MTPRHRVDSTWRHRLAHWLGWHFGVVETWTEGDRFLVGFRCRVCGLLSGVQEMPRSLTHPEERPPDAED